MKMHMMLILLSAVFFGVSTHAADDSRGMKVVYGEARTALVIGNSTYAANPLINPMNDAEDVASLLRQRKFNVRLLANADKKAMDVAIQEFGQRLEQGGVGLFYYAGHAVQIEGVNYLLPVDARPRKAHEVKYQGINVQQVLSEMATSRNRLNVVILDACRDNPFPALSRSLGSGLAKVDAPRGSLIAYATAPGKTAADGDGRNGVFTKNLLRQAAVPGKDILDMFRDVTAGVARDTKEKQEPWVHTSVRGKFYFTPIDFLDQELELTAAELARYKKLVAEQQAADAQLQRLESEKNAAIGQMEREIADLRRKMNQPGNSSDSLDQLVALADRREQYAKDLEAAKVKAEQEKRTREAEMARLRTQEQENRRKKFETAYTKYRRVAESKYMQPREKQQAWTLICQAWNVSDVTDAPGVLHWDANSGCVSAKPAGPTPGADRVVDLGGGMKLELVWINPGSFMMGSPLGESARDEDETQHRVTLTKGFWLGKYEVTQAQWQQVMGSNPSYSKNAGGKAPVENVSWNDCKDFLQKLNGKGVEGTFRLPTEAEWEYACRAGTTTRFGFGENDGDLHRYGNYCERSCTEDYSWKDKDHSDGHDKTAPVGSLKPNAWGLHDMHGNVWEWCQDWYGDYPSGSATDPAGVSSGSSRVLRGGSWFLSAGLCRSARRYGIEPSYRFSLSGLRVVLCR